MKGQDNLKKGEFGWIKIRKRLGGFIDCVGQTNGEVVFEKIIIKESYELCTSHILFGTILEKYVDMGKVRYEIPEEYDDWLKVWRKEWHNNPKK